MRSKTRERRRGGGGSGHAGEWLGGGRECGRRRTGGGVRQQDKVQDKVDAKKTLREQAARDQGRLSREASPQWDLVGNEDHPRPRVPSHGGDVNLWVNVGTDRRKPNLLLRGRNAF